MIVPIEPKVCEGVRQYFESNGEIEVPRPSRCPRPKAECGSTEPMGKNGSYPRQVIYWGLVYSGANRPVIPELPGHLFRYRSAACQAAVSAADW